MTVSLLFYLLILVVSAFLSGILLKSVKQPPVIGYLIAGVVLGLIFSGSQQHQTVDVLSELGILLLLFTLGLEFSLTRLKRVVKPAILGAVIQIVVSIWVMTLLMIWLGFNFFPALFMAAAFSLSSTAVIVKILSDKGELDTLPGEILVVWSVVQDLTVLPMMVILPVLGKVVTENQFNKSDWILLIKNIGLSVAVLTIILVLGKKFIPWLVKKIAALNSRELLLISVFAIAVAGALATQLLGLSAALGSFMAGLLIAESAQTHAIFSEIRPVRDIFALLFFTTLGLLLPSGFLFYNIGIILLLTLIVLVVKFLVVIYLMLYFGFHSKTSFIVSLGLIEVGEFAFVLARLGLSEKVISDQIFGIILSVALLSILATPPLFISAPLLYSKLRDYSKKNFKPLYFKFFASFEHHDLLEELPFKDHVVLCGYGRVGKYIGRALQMAEIPFVVVEYNQQKARELKKQGIEVVYGDPADIDILDYAQVDKARVVIIAIPDLHTQAMVISNSKKLNKDVKILCRSHYEDNQGILKALGVEAVIQPEFEASLSITDKILKLFGNTEKDISGKISRLKIEHGLG